jgi:hypothetical protein
MGTHATLKLFSENTAVVFGLMDGKLVVASLQSMACNAVQCRLVGVGATVQRL